MQEQSPAAVARAEIAKAFAALQAAAGALDRPPAAPERQYKALTSWAASLAGECIELRKAIADMHKAFPYNGL